MGTYTFDPTRYDGATTNASLIDDEARRLRVEIADLFMQGGRKISGVTPPAASTNANDDGKTCVGWETQANQDDTGYVTLAWDNAGTTALLRLYGSTHATKPNQIEPQGSYKFIGPGITSGLDPGHLHTQGGVIGGRGGTIIATGYLKPSAFRWAKGSGEGAQTVLALSARVGTPPSGGALVLEVRRTTSAPSTVQDVYNDGIADKVIATLTIASGEYESTSSALTNATLIDGLYIVPKVTTLNGSPADLTINAVISG